MNLRFLCRLYSLFCLSPTETKSIQIMKYNSLQFFLIASDKNFGLCVKNVFLPLKSYPYSTRKVSCISHVNRMIRLIIMFFITLPLTLNAQPVLEGTVQIRVNDPAVTVTADRLSAKVNETVTVTLQGLVTGKKAMVKVGSTFGKEEVEVAIVEEGTTYTFTMPAYPVFIDVDIRATGESTTAFYRLSVETLGVSEGKVVMAVTGATDGDVVSSGSSYQIKAGAKVTARLQTPLADGLSLLSIRGYAPDGSWQMTPLAGTDGKVPMEVTFTMPPTEVVLRFSIHEQSIPDPGPDPVPVYYNVTIPSVEGVATDPVAGTYRVEAWDNFVFYLTLGEDYDQSVPVVTTDRGDELTPRANDGAYIVKSVRQHVIVGIDGIRRNPAVGNEEIGKPTGGFSLHCSGNTLYICNDRPEVARIYTFGGSLVRTVKVAAGVQAVELPRGSYIVRIGEKGSKIVL